MWVALALERSDEYTRGRTCRVARPRTPRSCLRRQTQYRWHQPCCWLPFTHNTVVLPCYYRPRFSYSRRGDSKPPREHLEDRKSTRLNSSHLGISYAVFCL